MKNKKIFLKKLIKFFALGIIICYSFSVCFANVLYYCCEKKEISFFPKINFGIDIAGGNQLTVLIDTSSAITELTNNSRELLFYNCKSNKFVCNITNGHTKNDFLVQISKSDKNNNQETKLLKQFARDLRRQMADVYDVDVIKNDVKDFVVRINMTKKGFEKTISNIADKTNIILKNRIDGVGVKEISVQRYGNDKIVILVPKCADISRIKDIINTTAKLDFYLMDRTHIFSQKPKQIMKNHIFLQSYRPYNGINLIYMVENRPVLNGNYISNVQPVIDGISNSINFRLNPAGAKKFAEITKNNVGRLLAIVFDEKVLMAPMINTPIVGGNGSITGNFSSQEIQDLSVLLRSGSLPAKISIISEKFLNSIFDKYMLSSVSIAVCVCLLLVILLMIARYRDLGIIVFITLFLNLIFIVAIISIFGFTLTLPGIAGLVLTLGMATDANILIYEKMKELKKSGIDDMKIIIKNSFSRAIQTILDANITTIIACIALFGFGGSFIKGFSITLIFGIFCSLFTSVNITKLIINNLFFIKKRINF